MGTYSTRWLQQFHLISSGLDVKEVLPLPSGAKANKVWAKAVSRKETEKWPPIKLLFPSDRWVKTQSIQGPDGAGTFFGKSKQAVEKGCVEG
jgi:tyrosyl-DNA phosphodiesterase-1